MSIESTSRTARPAHVGTSGTQAERAPAAAGPGAWRRRVPWGTVAVLAVLLALSNGFWLQSLQGAVGAIERSPHPFASWMHATAVLVPVFVLTVLVVWALASRRYGDLSAPTAVVETGLALTAVATVVGIGALIANSAYDYHLQSNQLRLAQATHSTALSGGDGHADHGGGLLAQRKTLQTHVKGVELTSGLVLGSNLILIAWVIAARGGRLERAPRGRRQAPAAEASSADVV